MNDGYTASAVGVRVRIRRNAVSGTEPLVRITAEGESEELCALACKIIRSKIEENGQRV